MKLNIYEQQPFVKYKMFFMAIALKVSHRFFSNKALFVYYIVAVRTLIAQLSKLQKT